MLCCLLMSGCSLMFPKSTTSTSYPEEPAIASIPNAEPTEETILTPAPMEIIIYHGNEDADGFETSTYEVYYYNSDLLIEKLIETGVLIQGVELLGEEYNDTCLHLDFNDAFRDLVCSMGTTGEYIVIGSVVNTFLDNYSDVATSIYITANGDLLESGHVIYDFELSKFE